MKKLLMVVLILTVLFSAGADGKTSAMRKEWRTSFVESCVRNNGTLSACTCTADKLLSAYPGMSIYDFSIRMLKNKMTSDDKKALANALVQCMEVR